jgi:hypothetical protein
MEACWAKSLGNCSDKLSREHLVTESFFENDTVEMFGFPWCKEKPVRVGIAAATAKVLCTKHNSALSTIDEAGRHAFGALREIQRLNSIRKELKPHRWKIIKYTIDGPAFERWFLKTLINVCCNRGHPIGHDSTVKGRPSDRLVRIAYGLDTFRGKAGLYSVVRIGMNVAQDDTIGFMPLFHHSVNVEAAILSFRGHKFLMYLREEETPRLNDFVIDGEHTGNAALSHHVKRMDFNVGKYPSQQLVINW